MGEFFNACVAVVDGVYKAEEFGGTAADDSDSHRSTSSNPPSVLPKRTIAQAYSHSPPPTSRDVPRSRFHQPKSQEGGVCYAGFRSSGKLPRKGWIHISQIDLSLKESPPGFQADYSTGLPVVC